VDKPSIENRPLRELCNDAQRMSRAMIEHIEQGFLPKTRTLEQTVRLDEKNSANDPVTDITVRNQSAEVLKSEEFTQKLDKEFTEYLSVIKKNIADILAEESF